VTTCTVERQKDFLRNGSRALRPLTRAEVAASLGLHESIVSRAISGRYAMLPSDKIVPMSTFFSPSGGLAEELKRIVTSERQPLSDEEVAARLCLLGYSAARRTVTKYRNKLGIPAAAQRGDAWPKQSSQDCRLWTSSANLTS
jgi:RNA polymerase sigma-54 factor